MAILSEIFCSIQGEGIRMGERQIFVRFAGCDLRCRWCDTPDSLTAVEYCDIEGKNKRERVENPLGHQKIISAIRRLVESWKTNRVTLTGGEPLLQSESIEKILSEKGLYFILETGGHRPEDFRKVAKKLDEVSMDWKLLNSAGEKNLREKHIEFLKEIRGQEKPFTVKCVVDAQSDSEEIEDAARTISEYSDLAKLSSFVLQPVTPDGKAVSRPTKEQLFHWQSLSLPYLPQTRVLPQIHPILGFR